MKKTFENVEVEIVKIEGGFLSTYGDMASDEWDPAEYSIY